MKSRKPLLTQRQVRRMVKKSYSAAMPMRRRLFKPSTWRLWW